MKKRDLKADLGICNKATPGPWRSCIGSGLSVCTGVISDEHGMICDCLPEYMLEEGYKTPQDHVPNMKFIIAARDGWPHAIERAIEAEELSRELLKALKFFFKCLSNKDLVEPEPSHFLSLELSQIATLCHKGEEVLGDGEVR